MNIEQLLKEGRSLQKPTVLLKFEGSGDPAAMWYEYDPEETEQTNHMCWITVDCRHIPGQKNEMEGFLTVFTNEEDCETGYVEFSESWPDRKGRPLYPEVADIISPIDTVFMKGSDLVGDWLSKNNWQRDWEYNPNFFDNELIDQYQDEWYKTYPVYRNDGTIAALGGWHCPFDNDWHELIDSQLCILTVENSEPWVEVWKKEDGSYEVLQRIT